MSLRFLGPIGGVAFLLLLGCQSGEPEVVVRSAMAAAHEGSLERFLEHFDSKSSALLGMFWTVSQRYGYVEREDLLRLADLEILGTKKRGGVAAVTVRDDRREGVICLRQEDGRWRIDLTTDGCLEPER